MKEMKGFTLVELTIAIGVTALLMAAVYMAVNSAQRHSSAIEKKVTAQQDVKPALDLMAKEIGMASYNPTLRVVWVNPTGTCLGTATNQNYRGIQEATDNSLAVEMDISGYTSATGSIDGDGMLGDENEVIRYSYDTANQYIARATSCGTAQPFLGETATSGRPRVLVINDTLGLPIFRYFDGTGTEIASTALPAAIPNIRRVDITLAVETEYNDATTGRKRRLIYSTSVIPRNHAIN